jgi:transcriptional regulator with XRE-family HTH domain
MTQEQLAEAAELSVGYVSQLEGPGSYFSPSLKTLFKIAEVLGTTVSRLTDVED